MIALKCKMCGGNIEITGKGYGVCDSCFTTVTLPTVNDDKRTDFFNRGNHFRQLGDFDRAYSAFEHIIADDMTDAEAHWSLTLCRYGVEYVKDPRSGEYMPTVSRMSFSPILEDPDYLKALEFSDENTQAIYRAEAAKIAKIQENYLDISRREKPYDVFICFKAEEDNGQRTQGSIIAQDIYEELTENGVRTFFSRVTLRDIAGEKYEPYIFAALNSARVMLVVTNDTQHLQARWVKNEWMRFLNMKDKDRSKTLIPVCRGVSPYDLPMELQACGQSVDASVLGYKLDLKKRIFKLLGKSEAAQEYSGGSVDVVKSTVSNLLARITNSLKAGEFKDVLTYIEQIQSMDPDNADAMYYRLLAGNKAKSLDELINIDVDWDNNPAVERALKGASAQREAELNRFLQKARCERNYNQGFRYYKNRQYREAFACFDRVGNYKDAISLKAICDQYSDKDSIAREYKEKIGDGKTYLENQYKQAYPKEYQEYKKICDRKIKMGELIGAAGIMFLMGIVLLIINLFTQPQINDLADIIGTDRGLISISISNAKAAGYDYSIWPSVWYCVVLFIGFGVAFSKAVVPLLISGGFFVITNIIAVPLPVRLHALIAIFAIILGVLFAIIFSALETNAKKRKDKYHEAHVLSFEREERGKINDYYGKVLDNSEMVTLADIFYKANEDDDS